MIVMGFKRVLLDWVGNWIEGEMGLKGFLRYDESS